MATKVPFSYRGNYEDVCDCELSRGRRGTIQTYAGFEHDRGGFGGRIVDENGVERVYSEWYEDRETAARWIKIAIGLAVLAALAAGWASIL